jgi:predicted nucleic acid-binding protein
LCNINVLTNQSALSALDDLMALSTVAYREEPVGLLPVWRRLGALPSASTKIWMDAYLAAFADAGQLELITFDRAFAQFAGINITIVPPPSSA